MEEMYVYKNQQKLRWGYTTGTCGTAASMAAALMLFRQKRVSHVKVSTPKGIDLDLEIEETRFTKEDVGGKEKIKQKKQGIIPAFIMSLSYGTCIILLNFL